MNHKICFFIGAYYPAVNGAITQVALLSERLVRTGARVTIITARLSSKEPYYEKLNRVEVIRVKPAVGLRRIGTYLRIIPFIAALVSQRARYDLIIVNDLKVRGAVAVMISKILRKRCLLRAESCGEMDGTFAIQYTSFPPRWKTSLIKALVGLRNRVLLKADGFLSISSAITTEFLHAGVPSEKTIRVTNGIDTSRFSPVDYEKKVSLRKKLRLPLKKHFIFTGRLARGKGLEYLLRVWHRLVQEHPEIHLLLVGSGQDYSLSCEDELKSFVRTHQLQSTVTFTGIVRHLHQYLQAADYFVLPSQSEGLGLSLIEAMSCELPCIASAVGGILDVIDNNVNGILIPYGNENKLATAMEELLQNPDKAYTLGKAARKTVLRNFNIDNIFLQYLNLLDDFMPTNSCRGAYG